MPTSQQPAAAAAAAAGGRTSLSGTATFGPQYASDGDEEGDEIEEYEEVEEYEEEVEEVEEEEDEHGNVISKTVRTVIRRVDRGGAEDEFVDDEADDEEDEEVLEEEEEDEALMKYTTFPIHALRPKQEITCFGAFERLIFLGTNDGTVNILDSAEGGLIEQFTHHLNPVRDVSCDADEEFYISCCANTIAVQNIYVRQEYFLKNRDRPVNAVAIHPHYKEQKDKPIVYCGSDGKVVLDTKGRFLGNRSEHILHDNKGKIHAVRWRENVIVWANDTSVVLCNYSNKTIFATYPRPGSSPRADLYRCNLFWENDHTLIIGWANWVQIVKIRQRALEERMKSVETFQLQLTAEVEGGFETDRLEKYMVCGLAPYGQDKLLVLGCLIEGNLQGHIKELEVRIVNRVGGRDTYRGGLSTPKDSTKLALMYGLAHYPAVTMAESVYYIVAQRSVIKATPCDDDDHIDHLMRQRQFVEAFEFAKCRPSLKRHAVKAIGTTLLNHLIECNDYVRAASYFREVLGSTNDAAPEWEHWIALFDRRGQSEVLVDFLPHFVGGQLNGPQIKSEFIELVLNRCLETDVSLFKDAIKKFNMLYSHATLCNVVETRYKKMRTDRAAGRNVNEHDLWVLGETFGLLLEFQGNNNEALDVLMDVKDSGELFEFIKRHKLYRKAAEILEKLFAKDKARTIDLLLHHEKSENEDELDDLNPDAIVKKLETSHPDSLWAYLKALEVEDNSLYQQTAKRHAQLFAELYAERDPKNLLRFLKVMANSGLSVRKAYDMCKRMGFLEESVFLMSKMGHQEEGLRIIVNDMRHIGKAIEFIKEFPGDDDQAQLFRKLIEFVMEADAKLKGKAGAKYFEHVVLDTDTWASIAEKYGLKEVEIRAFNGAAGASMATLPRPVLVPINMLGQLLTAVSDPQISEQTAIDPIYLIDQLPPSIPIPNIGNSLSKIAESKSRHKQLMETQKRVLHGDLAELQRAQHTARAAGIRMNPRAKICTFCNDVCAGTDVVIFQCHHAYHPKCIIDYLIEQGELKAVEKTIMLEMDDFFENPLSVLPKKPRKPVPYCLRCPPMETEKAPDVIW